jgi:phosphatidylinositol alpha-mannosyltransferase
VDVAQYAAAEPLDGYPRAGGTVGFIGRYDEPRKGMDVLVEAVEHLAPARPDLRVLVAGRGDAEHFLDGLPREVAARVDLLGMVSEADKARMLRSVDVYCAPNTGQESFGIVLLEAMAAGTPVVASDIDAFRRVLDDGRAGRLFEVGDPGRLAAVLAEVLTDPDGAAELVRRGRSVVEAYDWRAIAARIVGIYQMVSGDRRVSVDPG